MTSLVLHIPHASQMIPADVRDEILHRALTNAAEAALARHGRCLVLDCHSFPARPLPYEIDQRHDRPEICLGTDAFHTPKSLAEAALRAFEDAGFEVALNRPFAGALVPSKHHEKHARVSALMVEVRRDLYMDEASGARHSRFGRIRTQLQEIVERIHREWQGG